MRYIKNVLISFTILIFIAGTSAGLFFLQQITDWSVVLVLMLGLIVINAATSIIVFVQNRSSQSKQSWLLAINIFPYLGAALFYIFGQRYSQRKSYQKYVNKKYIKLDKRLNSNKIKANVDDLNKIAHTSKRDVYKTDIELFPMGAEALTKMFDDMRKAKKFIHIHFYIVKPGEIYDEFKKILVDKAKQGVEIRFIVDDFGMWGMPYHQVRELKSIGIKVGVFGRVDFPFIGSENGYRTHRKVVIIDGKIVHTGGLNIGNEYSSLSKKIGLWVDLQGSIKGEFVKSHSLLFLQDWELVTGKKLSEEKYIIENSGGSSYGTLVEDSPENSQNIMENTLSRLILNAKKSIHITTPYLVPTNIILSALKNAALSGVKVHVYISGLPDKKLVYTVTKYYANKLQKLGVIIHEMNDMFIHSKVGLFDDVAYFGTANIDVRSLYSQFEMINIIKGKDVKQFRELFTYYNSLSTVVPDKKYDTNIVSERFIRLFINLFSPIM